MAGQEGGDLVCPAVIAVAGGIEARRGQIALAVGSLVVLDRSRCCSFPWRVAW
jgi:hypothetical protein